MPFAGFNLIISVAISLSSLRGSHKHQQGLGRTRDMANENEQNEYSCDMYRQCHLGNGASHKTHASPVTGGTYHKMHVSPATNGMLQLDILICPVSTTVQ